MVRICGQGLIAKVAVRVYGLELWANVAVTIAVLGNITFRGAVILLGVGLEMLRTV